MKNLFFFTLLMAGLQACTSATKKPDEVQMVVTPEVKPGFLSKARNTVQANGAEMFSNAYSDTSELKIFFASNRNQGGVELGEMGYGVATVHVSKDHPVGALEPDLKVNESKPVTLDELKSGLKESTEWGVLVFVHGFNVDYNEALLRAAQISFDLKFQGKVFLISWPAGSSGGILEKTMIKRTYEQNQKNARASIQPVSEVFKELAGLGLPMSLMVHSMGHQVVVPALDHLAPALEKPIFDEIIFNAPDLDPGDFEKAAPGIKRISKRLTIYCSPADHALRASKAINGNRRLGVCSLQEGVDVVNVNEIDDPGITALGHGYYSSRPVLTDLYQILIGIPAEKRLFIKKADSGAQENFILRK